MTTTRSRRHLVVASADSRAAAGWVLGAVTGSGTRDAFIASHGIATAKHAHRPHLVNSGRAPCLAPLAPTLAAMR